MTDNQVKQMMKMMTQCVNGIQRLEKDMEELKVGQNRLEKGLEINNKAFNELAGENLRVKIRVDELESREMAN